MHRASSFNSRPGFRRFGLLLLATWGAGIGLSLPSTIGADRAAADGATEPRELARRILADKEMDEVLRRARELVKTGFNAGSGYREVWIRDYATFIELSCEVYDLNEVRENLLIFFRMQGEDGNIIDGFVPRRSANVNYKYIRKSSLPDYLGHKNTVETDQETSLVHAVHTYVNKTGDRAFLGTKVQGRTVLERLEFALEFLLQHRFSEKNGLLWGATTADWGDVQPEHPWGVELDDNSHLSIDIYDNAMFVIAIDNLRDLIASSERDAAGSRDWEKIRKQVAKNIRRRLWDPRRQKFVPHVYLGESPFPADLDEDRIYYHGGTAVAILAGLLSPDEIRASLEAMRRNVAATGAASVGLTLYPPYPAGTFKNPGMRPYGYQNGGDWTWFGGRMIRALIENGFTEEAYIELRPMLQRVLKHDGFHEWYDIFNQPRGSGTFRGSAGVLAKAIVMLRDWARERGRE